MKKLAKFIICLSFLGLIAEQASAQNFELPSDMVLTSTQGCKFINPNPSSGSFVETADWLGQCESGYAKGYGEIHWFEDGKKTFISKDVFMENGLWLNPFMVQQLDKFALLSENLGAQSNCAFVLPIRGMKAHRDHFSLRYKSENGECPTTSEEKNSQFVQVEIKLKDQRVGYYEGELDYGFLPRNGKLIFAGGTELSFPNMDYGDGDAMFEDHFNSYQNSISLNESFETQTVVLPSVDADNSVPSKYFNLKPVFTADAQSAEMVSGKLLGLINLTVIDNTADLGIAYSITPKHEYISQLKSSEYDVILVGQFNYTLHTPVGGLVGYISSDKELFKKTTIKLKREQGYRAEGKIDFGSVETYTTATAGFETTLRDLTGSAYIFQVTDPSGETAYESASSDIKIIKSGNNSNLSGAVQDSVSEAASIKRDLDIARREAYERDVASGKYQNYTSDTQTSSTSPTSSARVKTSTSGVRQRGVKNIQSNGKISGVPSFAITCTTGSRHIIYNKNGTWYHGSLGNMGGKFNGLSREAIGDHACKNL